MGLQHSPRIVTDGLILCLDAANKQSYPGSGTVWTDLAGSNNGTLTNGPTFSSANGGSIVFDGSDDFIELNQDLLLSSSFSISFAFKQNSPHGDWVRLIGHGGAVDTRFWGIWIPSTRDALLWQSYAGGGNLYTSTYNFNLNQTYIITFISTGLTLNFYINGILFQSVTESGSINYSGNASKIRVGWAGYHTFLNGNISQVSIYNRALTPAEVLQNYNATKGRYNL